MAQGLQDEAEVAGPGPGSERDQKISDASKSAKRSACLASNMQSPDLQLGYTQALLYCLLQEAHKRAQQESG